MGLECWTVKSKETRFLANRTDYPLICAKRHGVLADVGALKEACRANIGDVTFQVWLKGTKKQKGKKTCVWR